MPRTILAALVLLASCGEAPPPPPSASTPPPSTPEPPSWCVVEGVVVVDSDDLDPLTGSVRGFEKYCGQGPLDIGAYRVDRATKGLAGAFVEADGRSEDFKVDGVPVMDQKACLFTPSLLVAPPGPVVFKNSDTMAHNVTTAGLLNPIVKEGFSGGQAISRNFPFDEKLALRCSVHPWMVASLVVTRRAAHAVTDAQGRFRIEKVEAGRRKIKVWHLFGEEAAIDVDAPKNGTIRVEIKWKPKAGFRAAFGR